LGKWRDYSKHYTNILYNQRNGIYIYIIWIYCGVWHSFTYRSWLVMESYFNGT
jgi:hypothetical protein